MWVLRWFICNSGVRGEQRKVWDERMVESEGHVKGVGQFILRRASLAKLTHLQAGVGIGTNFALMMCH